MHSSLHTMQRFSHYNSKSFSGYFQRKATWLRLVHGNVASNSTSENRSFFKQRLIQRYQHTLNNATVKESSVDIISNTTEISSVSTNRTNANPTENKVITKTGMFIKQWPEVYVPETHFRRAMKKVITTVKEDQTTKNYRQQQRKFATKQIDMLMQSLTKPITQLLDLYSKKFQDLHPYEATVANLTIIARVKAGFPDLKEVLKRLKALRAATSKIGKKYCKEANLAPNAKEAQDLCQAAFDELQNLYNSTTSAEAVALNDLVEIHKDLRRIPVIDLTLPTIVLVGSPNVGKSSIVRAISSGTPEVNDYPFTTRGVTIGHIIDNEFDRYYQKVLENPSNHPLYRDIPMEILNSIPIKFQVMDTPGLLDRPEIDRNEMERLTYASLLHLPTAVMFVIDHTGLSGEKSTIHAQINVRKVLKGRFPKRPWIDIISKGDIPMEASVKELLINESILPHNFENIDEFNAKKSLLASINAKDLEEKQTFLIVSVKDGKNIELLKSYVTETLYSLREILFFQFKNSGSNSQIPR